MGLKLTSNETLAPWYSKVVPPVTRNLEAWLTFDTDIARFPLNRAIGKPRATVVGQPVAYPTHGRFKGNTNYLITQVKDVTDVTLFAVVRAVTVPTSNADGIAPVSSYSGNSLDPQLTGVSGGSSLFLRANQVVSAGMARKVSGAYNLELLNLVGGEHTAWRLLVVKSKSGGKSKVYDLTFNTENTGTDINPRLPNDQFFRIGSATRDYAGESDISAVAIYSTDLTDDEVRSVAESMRKRMARLGIAV